MLEFLENRLGGCLALFILIALSLWYLSPELLFEEDGNTKSLDIGNFSVNRFGICIIIISIFVYYIYALIRYSFD